MEGINVNIDDNGDNGEREIEQKRSNLFVLEWIDEKKNANLKRSINIEEKNNMLENDLYLSSSDDDS